MSSIFFHPVTTCMHTDTYKDCLAWFASISLNVLLFHLNSVHQHGLLSSVWVSGCFIVLIWTVCISVICFHHSECCIVLIWTVHQRDLLSSLWMFYCSHLNCVHQDPMGYIDLKRCITEKVGLISRDICARPNTFELVSVRQPRKGEKDTLVSRTYNTMTTIR